MFGPPGLAGVPNMGLQSLFPGAGGTTGGGAGYVGPGLQGDDIIGAGFEETLGGGKNTGAEGGGKPTRKRSGATRGKGAETEWDGALEDDGGGPMSPRNREYRRKMIELDAEQKVGRFWLFAPLRWVCTSKGGVVAFGDTRAYRRRHVP